MPKTNDWIPIREAAILLQVSPWTLLRWEKSGILRRRPPGKSRPSRIQFRRRDLLAVLDPPVETHHTLLTKASAAKQLQVDARTINRWLQDGRLPCSRLPHRGLRFRREDIEALGRDHPPRPDAFVACAICGATARSLAGHVQREHGLKPAEYQGRFPGAKLLPDEVRARCQTLGMGSAEQSRKAMAEANDLVRIYYALSDDDRERFVAAVRRFLAPEQLQDLEAGRRIRRAGRLRRR